MNLIRKPTKYNTIEFTEGTIIPHFYFPAFKKTNLVSHLFTSRLGGVSQGIFSSMNLSSNRGDDKEKVLENYRRVASELGCEIKDFCFSDQTHTTNIKVITEEDRGKGIVKPQDYKDIDGIITNVKGIALGTFYADCVPLYFLDPEHKAIGLSHSGWKGTVGKIGKVTIEAMTKEYNTDPSKLLCGIAPSICTACYEIGEDVAEHFIKAFNIKKIPLWDGIGENEEILLWKKNEEKYQLNLWACNIKVLLDAGVPKENISVTNICTCCNPEVLFSHRKTQGKRGNMGAFMMLK